MLRTLKYFIYLLMLTSLLFVAFAYAGPTLGINFSADMQLIELPFNLKFN